MAARPIGVAAAESPMSWAEVVVFLGMCVVFIVMIWVESRR